MNGVVLMCLPHIAADEPAHARPRDEVGSIMLLRRESRNRNNSRQCTSDDRNQLSVPVLVGDHRGKRPGFDGVPGWEGRAAVEETTLVVFRIGPISARDRL